MQDLLRLVLNTHKICDLIDVALAIARQEMNTFKEAGAKRGVEAMLHLRKDALLG